MYELLARWSNRVPGRERRCDIWFERRLDDRLQVRWQGWDFTEDEPGTAIVPDGMAALWVAERLIRLTGGPDEDGGPWGEVPMALYH